MRQQNQYNERCSFPHFGISLWALKIVICTIFLDSYNYKLCSSLSHTTHFIRESKGGFWINHWDMDKPEQAVFEEYFLGEFWLSSLPNEL